MNIKKAIPSNITKAAEIIKQGGVVVYPTETVYGIGCDPYDPQSTERVNKIKGRTGKPLPLVCSSLKIAQEHAQFHEDAHRLASHFWPGPLMLILPATGRLPHSITQGQTTIGLRVSGSEVSRQLAEQSGGCIVSTSANKSGQPSATTAEMAAVHVGSLVDMVLDGGSTPGDVASTVLDLSGSEPRILREGPISIEEIIQVLG